jgi:hypothetical protein
VLVALAEEEVDKGVLDEEEDKVPVVEMVALMMEDEAAEVETVVMEDEEEDEVPADDEVMFNMEDEATEAEVVEMKNEEEEEVSVSVVDTVVLRIEDEAAEFDAVTTSVLNTYTKYTSGTHTM